MMIHHATIKAAEKAGIILLEHPEGGFIAKWPERNRSMIGDNAANLLKDIVALKELVTTYTSFTHTVTVTGEHPNQRESHTVAFARYGITTTSSSLAVALAGTKKAWTEHRAAMTEEELEAEEAGVEEETTDEEKEAEQAEVEAEKEEEEARGGSVVSDTYRKKYAEEGHPTNCGDEMATFLANYCKSTEAQSLQIFEDVCALNGVDTHKYNRTTQGWQGRLRMTGRNMLAKRVFEAGGKLKLLNDEVHQMGGEWMAAQKYTKGGKKAEPAPVAPVAATPTPDTMAAEDAPAEETWNEEPVDMNKNIADDFEG